MATPWRRALAAFVALPMMLGLGALAGAQPAPERPPLRIAVEALAPAWTEVAADPRTYRCTGCEPTVVMSLAQRADAWPDMPERVRAMDGTSFTRDVLADEVQRRALLEGILREVRNSAPGFDVEASLVGPKTIGMFDFVEAHVAVRIAGGLVAARAFLTFHKGWLVQVVAMYGVADLPEAVAGEIDRFLQGISFEE